MASRVWCAGLQEDLPQSPTPSRLHKLSRRFSRGRGSMSRRKNASRSVGLVAPIDPRVTTSVMFITKNLRRLPSATRLPRTVNLSTSRFYELFKAQTGTCPASYIKNQRMSAAAKLLSASLKSVKEIAAEVGFNDQSHFVRDFKRRYGMTPTTYRRRFYQASSDE
jgi:AraC-like DNA-binding protein